jgi:hypothetical protein
VNAYEAEGGEVVVDVARHPRMFDLDWQMDDAQRPCQMTPRRMPHDEPR